MDFWAALLIQQNFIWSYYTCVHNSYRQLYKVSEIVFDGGGGIIFLNFWVISIKCAVPLVMFNSLDKVELVSGKSVLNFELHSRVRKVYLCIWHILPKWQFLGHFFTKFNFVYTIMFVIFSSLHQSIKKWHTKIFYFL